MNELVSINGSLEDEFLFATPLKKHVCAQSTMIDFQTSSWSVCLKFIYHYVTKFERKTQGRIPFLQKVENANFHKSDRHMSCVLQLQMSNWIYPFTIHSFVHVK